LTPSATGSARRVKDKEQFVAIATSTSVTEAIARFVCDADFSTAPAELYSRATRAFIDTVGVAIAGRGEPAFTILARTVQADSAGRATILPTRGRASAGQAALLNGVAGHALDYDDVADQVKGHPSVVLVSALLAVAEARQSSGRELLEAYVVGFETACAVAAGINLDAHYRKGWHATATICILGAAAGAGRLLGLDPERLQYALGIAATMASGSRQNFGTMTKPLHAGLAARDAVLAAELAAGGFTSDPHQLDAPLGYFNLYGVDPDVEAVHAALAKPHVLLEHGLNVKKFPCCYNTHRMADAALALRAGGLRPADVHSISVSIEPDGLGPIIHHQPRTGLQGKFSGEYVVAACLLDGAVRLATFTDEAVSRPEAQDLLRRIHIEEAALPPFGAPRFEHGYAGVEVTLQDGSTLRERCEFPRGDAREPLTDAELEAKFRDCLAFSGGDWDADRLLAELKRLPDMERVSLS
jgi:2-methylcitrate dehydratase PrpD